MEILEQYQIAPGGARSKPLAVVHGYFTRRTSGGKCKTETAAGKPLPKINTAGNWLNHEKSEIRSGLPAAVLISTTLSRPSCMGRMKAEC
jgi:hypothetical protein